MLLLQPLLLAELAQALTRGCLESGSARQTRQLSLERRVSELALLLEVLGCGHRAWRGWKQCGSTIADWRLRSLSR